VPGLANTRGMAGAEAQRAEAAKGVAAGLARGLLKFQQLVLARDRQARQRGARGDGGAVDAFQDAGKGRRMGLRMRDLLRQRGQLGGSRLACGRCSRVS
jgi:hypothetical protein